MYSEQQNDLVSAWIREAAMEACSALFDAYGVCVSPTPEGPLSEQSELLYCGVIGFMGADIRGTCLLAASEDPLLRSRPVEGSIRDWTGELTNQLAGRLKVRLLGRGVRIAITTPVVLRGEHLAPLPRRALRPVAFDANPGAILVWVEAETGKDFVLEAATPEASLAPESDFVLF